MKGYIIFENFNKLIECKEILDGDYTCVISDCSNGMFSGVINRVTGARCNKDDTYDFKVGALIALMKMCGVDKVKKAAKETFFDVAENSVNEYEEEIHALKEEIKSLKIKNKYYIEDINRKFEYITEFKRSNDILKEENEKLKLDCEKLQHGYNDMIFCGGRQNGKQYTALVNMFKKLDQKKVDAAYKEAYQIKDFSEEINYLTVDSLIEQSRAFTRKCVNEWLYKIPTKRDEMWEKIFALHKESDVIIKVKREDINTFLHEIENKIPEITWASGDKIFETKYAIGDIYGALKTCDMICFRLWRANKLSYLSNPDIYLYKDLHRIDYLSPMRWDLFKKGRLAVKVTYENYKGFYDACERELGKKPATIYCGDFTVSICKKDGMFEIFDIKDQDKKIVNWEDVR